MSYILGCSEVHLQFALQSVIVNWLIN